ncbi:MAG: sulfite exporter TauE/SafE family protein [Lachnospiraceae bacterium]|nr:sulfite exporter TauE/SafE family protein [Lachnospiraceae bacterium]
MEENVVDGLIKILVCFFAGAGAGIGTGFAGMSAAAVIGPILVTFLGITPYKAVGIGLISDVLASAISAYTYKKSGNLDIKNSIPMMLSVLVFTVVGSLVAKLLPEQAMGGTMQVALIFLGLRFILKPVTTTKEQMKSIPKRERLLKAVIGGSLVGFICGFVGAGGGMMMLFVLTSFLGYQMHMAVGTSVFIMAFTALTGGISHFAIGGIPDIMCLVLCVLFTLLWARLASGIANKTEAKTLNRVVGIVMILTSAVILVVNYIK